MPVKPAGSRASASPARISPRSRLSSSRNGHNSASTVTYCGCNEKLEYPMAKPIQYQVLAEARLLIGDPGRWCQGRFAVSRTGRTLVSGSQRAAQHCAVSAIMAAARRTAASRADANRIADSIMLGIAPHGSDPAAAQRYIWTINDRHGHEAVKDLFDTALALY
jgi:hypothetical protein